MEEKIEQYKAVQKELVDRFKKLSEEIRNLQEERDELRQLLYPQLRSRRPRSSRYDSLEDVL